MSENHSLLGMSDAEFERLLAAERSRGKPIRELEQKLFAAEEALAHERESRACELAFIWFAVRVGAIVLALVSAFAGYLLRG